MTPNAFLATIRAANDIPLHRVAKSMKYSENLVQSIEKGLTKVPEGMFEGYAHLLEIHTGELMGMYDSVRGLDHSPKSPIVYDNLVIFLARGINDV